MPPFWAENLPRGFLFFLRVIAGLILALVSRVRAEFLGLDFRSGCLMLSANSVGGIAGSNLMGALTSASAMDDSRMWLD